MDTCFDTGKEYSVSHDASKVTPLPAQAGALTDRGEACSVCIEPYTETGDRIPKVLGCGHSLCKRCIDKITLPSKQINCPECRKTSTDSATNFLAKSLLNRKVPTTI